MPPRPSALRPALAGALLALPALGACGTSEPPEASAPAGFSFAVMGDTPYDEQTEEVFPELSRRISDADVRFVVHIGDVKGSGAPCTDSLLAQRIAAVDAVGRPVVFVPGDNDWTDCHRNPAGIYAPLERLAFLRGLAYPEPGRSLGTPALEVESQALTGAPEFPEHQRWTHQGVVFATLHVVGSRNGLEDFATRTPEDDAEVERRIRATVAWLRETFARARADGAPAVVVAIQANPWHLPPSFEGRTGFEEFLDGLTEESAAFAKPVLLIHGDSHTVRFDRPFWQEEAPVLPNLMRLETYGSPDVGWVEVRVDPTAPGVFGFTPHPVLLGGVGG